jgi:hemoglobin
MSDNNIYEQLGGHNSIKAFVDELFSRVKKDKVIGRYWTYRGTDGLARERQLAIEYFEVLTEGSDYYSGRDMLKTHQGMGITKEDWQIFINHADSVMSDFSLPDKLKIKMLNLITELKDEIIEM